MKRKKKSSWAWNFLLLIICAALTVALAGFIAWDSKTEAAKNEKLVQEAKKGSKKENIKGENKSEKEDNGKEEDEKPKEEKKEEDVYKRQLQQLPLTQTVQQQIF